MVTALDDVVGNMVKQLKDVGMYERTVIIFSSDNGGIKENRQANLPLKGNESLKPDINQTLKVIN